MTDPQSLPADRVRGAMLGIAVGDALGLPAEGMSARAVARRFGVMDRYRLIGRAGIVSDDTEQSALVAQALLDGGGDLDTTVRRFRRSMAGWVLRLPWGIGLATLKACLLLCFGVTRAGRPSAGNGAAMRAVPVGLVFARDPTRRRDVGRALAEVTHTDERAVQAALFVAELAALCVLAPPTADRRELVNRSLAVVSQPELHAAIVATTTMTDSDALRCTGYSVYTLQSAVYTFIHHGDRPLAALQASIALGGDTDSIAAILGGWCGALGGESALPAELVAQLHDGPFGPTHLCDLAAAILGGGPRPSYSPAVAMLRNLALYPVILAHGFRRLLPW